jgi:hypothetical protein
MTKTVVWVHGDSLSAASAALRANPGAPAIFVFDDALLASYQLSLKRMVFLYECLLEMPVVIRRGDIVAEVLAFAHEHGAVVVETTPSPSPYFRQISERLSQKLTLLVHCEPPFAEDRSYSLGRFFRYWSKAEASILGGGRR